MLGMWRQWSICFPHEPNLMLQLLSMHPDPSAIFCVALLEDTIPVERFPYTPNSSSHNKFNLIHFISSRIPSCPMSALNIVMFDNIDGTSIRTSNLVRKPPTRKSANLKDSTG